MVKGYLPASKLKRSFTASVVCGRAIAVTAQSDQIVIKVVLPVPGVNETTQYYGDPYFGQVFLVITNTMVLLGRMIRPTNKT